MWAPTPSDRSSVPVLLYHGVAPIGGFSKRADADLGIDPEDFARHMTLLNHAGYETITLDEFVRFISREHVSLPPRPLLLTFDGARLDSWTGSDGILGDLELNAVLFVDVGRVEAKDPAYLTWKELNTLQDSGRWDVQLQSGTGNLQIRYGSAPGDVGPFYAYRGSEEVLGGWRERVFFGHHLRLRNSCPSMFGATDRSRSRPHIGNYWRGRTNDRRRPTRASGPAAAELRGRLHPGSQRLRVPGCVRSARSESRSPGRCHRRESFTRSRAPAQPH